MGSLIDTKMRTYTKTRKHQRADVPGQLAELVRLADRWGDDSVAAGWLVRRARVLLGVELDTRTAFRMIVARRRRGLA